MGNNLRDDKNKRELLKRNLKKIIDGIDNGVSTEKIIEKIEEANYFGIEDTPSNKKKYIDAIKGFEANNYGLFQEVEHKVDDFLIDKHANPEMYFQTFLSEGILEIIYQKSTEYNEFNRDIYVDEMTIPDLEIIANTINKELGKDPKYSKEEIEKDILKAEEVNKEKEEEKEY